MLLGYISISMVQRLVVCRQQSALTKVAVHVGVNVMIVMVLLAIAATTSAAAPVAPLASTRRDRAIDWKSHTHTHTYSGQASTSPTIHNSLEC